MPGFQTGRETGDGTRETGFGTGLKTGGGRVAALVTMRDWCGQGEGGGEGRRGGEGEGRRTAEVDRRLRVGLVFWFLSAHAPRGPGASTGQPDPPRGWRPDLAARAGMACGARRGVGPPPEEDRPRRGGGAAPRRGQRVEPACLRPVPRARGEGPPCRCRSSPIRSPAFWPSQRGADVGGRGGGPGVRAVPPPKKQKQKKRAPAGAGGGGRATASKKKNEKHSPRRPPPRALPPRPHASHPSSPRTVRVAFWVTGVGFMREAIVMRWGRGGKREGKGSKNNGE